MRHGCAFLALFWLGFVTTPARSGFIYNDFSSTAGLQLNGNAAQVGNALRLTNASSFQAGSAFTTASTSLGNLNSFSTHFRFRITNSGGVSDTDGIGADGIVFVIQTVSNNVGAAGGGIGYLGINPSIGIEFDTWDNGSGFNDPNGNHVGYDLNGSFTANTVVENTRFNNDGVWDAWIDYNGATNTLEARWSAIGIRGLTPQLVQNVDLVSVLGQNNAFLGFTSGTGSAFGNHDILSWEYRDEFNPIGAAVPEPMSLIQWGLWGSVALLRGWKRDRRRR